MRRNPHLGRRAAVVASTFAALATAASAQAGSVSVQDLSHGPTATGLAESLAGAGVSVSNVTYTGSPRAAGEFTGGAESIGFENGVVLDTGKVQSDPQDEPCSKGVEGPNTCYERAGGQAGGPAGEANSTSFGFPGNQQLTELSGFETFDASVLEFEFVPQHPTLQVSYVFGSEEYSDFANTPFNDVFAFYVDGKNCALVPATSEPVSVNTINNGSDAEGGDTTPHHASLFRDNVRPKPTIDTQMDGLTTVLQCNAAVNVGVKNRMKLAIADAADELLDSAVFLESGSLISGTQVTTSLSGGGKTGEAIAVREGTAVSDTATLAGTSAHEATGTVEYKVFSDPECGKEVASAGSVSVSGGVVPSSQAKSLARGTYYWQAHYSGDSHNNAATSTCGAEVETVEATTKATTLTTKLSGEGKSGAKISVKEGTDVTDTVTLSGENAAKATGTVAFRIYSDSGCAHLVTSGAESISPSLPITAEETLEPAGKYYWVVNYEGDSSNEPSESKCGTEIETVEGVPKPTALSTTLSGDGKSAASIAVKEGSAVKDLATLSGENTSTATGTIEYKVYSDAECKKLVASAGSETLSSGARLGSEAETLKPAGKYYWQASYGGDLANAPSKSECGSEVETVEAVVTKGPTELTTSLSGEGKSGASISVKEGAAVTDNATLKGEHAASASGSAEYKVYSDSGCTKLVTSAGSASVSAGSVGASEAKTLPAGTYYWQASYGGDSLNEASKSACGSEVEKVEAATGPLPTKLATALTGEGRSGASVAVKEGAPVSDSAMLSGESASKATGSVEYNVYSDPACTKLVASAGKVSVTAGSVPGSEAKTLVPAGKYYWRASYSGDLANAPSKSECGSEVETVEKLVVSQPTTITTSLSGEGKTGEWVTVTEGAPVADAARLSGANASLAGGTLEYSVYGDAACTKLVAAAGKVTVAAGAVPPSEAKTLAAGTYYWRASYSGDLADSASKSKCGSEIETVERVIEPRGTTVRAPLSGELGAIEEAKPVCSKLVGAGHWGPRGAKGGSLVNHLSTTLSARQELHTTTPRPRRQIRLGRLRSASCVAIPGGFQFSGSGPAKVNRRGGYTASFAIRETDRTTSYTLLVEKGGKTVFKLLRRALGGGGSERFT